MSDDIIVRLFKKTCTLNALDGTEGDEVWSNEDENNDLSSESESDESTVDQENDSEESDSVSE